MTICRYLAGLLFVLLATPPVLAEMTAAEKKEMQRLQREVQLLQQENRTLKHKLDALQNGRRPGPVVPVVKQTVPMDDDPRIGDPGARIALVEFSDYQCPFCKRFHDQTFDRIKKHYIDEGKLVYVYRDFLLGRNKNSLPASTAANCAGEQGKYFEMQKLLYQNARRLSDRMYPRLARKIGLDMGSFESCMLNQNHVTEIRKDYEDGRQLGIRGTPAFFVGRIKDNELIDAVHIRGAQPYKVFKQAIEDALKK